MADVLFDAAPLEARVLTLADMQRRLDQITGAGAAAFRALKQKPEIDRALPRLVAAVTLTRAFGYSQIELTERELGVGLMIEAGSGKTPQKSRCGARACSISFAGPNPVAANSASYSPAVC